MERVEQQANLADEKASIFELASLVFAIGLAASAWAALVGSGRRIRLTFLLIALASLVAGLGVIVRVLFI